MNLQGYLRRIEYKGPLEPTLETLRRLHRAHLLAIPYENLDIHLGRRLELSEERIFDKLVLERRGGWCFEMNGLFAWALREMGFAPHLLAGAVDREKMGEATRFTHLVLLVELERPYLVDVGFGNGFLEPLPLAEGAHSQGFLRYRLERLDTSWWRYRQVHGGPSFDFTLEPCALADFTGACHILQTSPESGFVRLSVCYRFVPEGVLSLRGATLGRLGREGLHEEVLETKEAYGRVLREAFGLEPDGLDKLWGKVWQNHLAWRSAQASAG